MITIPVGGGLLYIEPVYVTANAAGSNGSYPSLQRVFAFYSGHPVGFQPTLQEALAQVFTGTSGQARPGGGGSGGSVNTQVIDDLKQAQQFYARAKAALRNGDLAAYAQYITKMEQQISKAQAVAARAGVPAGRGGHLPERVVSRGEVTAGKKGRPRGRSPRGLLQIRGCA